MFKDKNLRDAINVLGVSDYLYKLLLFFATVN